MNRNWMYVFGSAIFEVMWVIGLKHAETAWEWIGTGIAILVSFYGLMSASKELPVGTVYAVFVGLGTAGTVGVDLLIFHEPWTPLKLILLLVLLVGVIGLKMSSKESEENTTGETQEKGAGT
ncbi:DMT family transporter [Paenibacillus sp. HJGM_3]|uniref:DMT family transporter n=1 Tax=Paenibacillus sp. HJGM_3 TaxID=3379816 RepID=UPI00385B89DA